MSEIEKIIDNRMKDDIITARIELDRKVYLAKERAYLRLVEQCETTRLRKLIRKNEFKTIPHLEEYKDQFAEPKEDKVLTDYYFVTVNPKPSVALTELKEKVDKFTHRKVVQAAEWSYEQRSSDLITSGSGMHVHLIVQKPNGLRNKYFQDQTRESFKTLVGNPQTHVDIRPMPGQYVKDKRSYLQDVKTGEGKADKQAVDKVWRVDNNLKDYYETTNKIQCLTPIQDQVNISENELRGDVSVLVEKVQL